MEKGQDCDGVHIPVALKGKTNILRLEKKDKEKIRGNGKVRRNRRQ